MILPRSWKPTEWLAERLFALRPEPHGWRGIGARGIQVLYLACSGFRRDLCWERSSALSFATIVSLIPLSVLFLSIIGQSTSQEQLHQFIKDQVFGFLIPDASVRNSIWDVLQREISTTAFRFTAGVNLTALAGLVAAATALLVTAERVFNKLWGVQESRGYFQKVLIFWIVLTLSPLALGASLYFDQITRAGTVIGELKARFWILGILYSFVVPALISVVAFAILHRVLPNIRVRFGPALLGALVSAVLWEVAKKGFYLYVQEAHRYAKFFGALGVLPVFLVWVYATWVIILFGTEVARAAQFRERLVLQRRMRLHDPRRGSPTLAVRLLLWISGSFEAGRPVPEVDEIASEWGLDPALLVPIVETLVQAGILVGDGSRAGVYLPSRSPRMIRIQEVLDLIPGEFALMDLGLAGGGGRGVAGTGVDARYVALLASARLAFRSSFGDQVISDLLPQIPAPKS